MRVNKIPILFTWGCNRSINFIFHLVLQSFDSFSLLLHFQIEKITGAPGTIFTVMYFTVILILLYVPETRGHELAEVKVWYTEHSGLRQRKKKNNKTLGDLELFTVYVLYLIFCTSFIFVIKDRTIYCLYKHLSFSF